MLFLTISITVFVLLVRTWTQPIMTRRQDGRKVKSFRATIRVGRPQHDQSHAADRSAELPVTM